MPCRALPRARRRKGAISLAVAAAAAAETGQAPAGSRRRRRRRRTTNWSNCRPIGQTLGGDRSRRRLAAAVTRPPCFQVFGKYCAGTVYAVRALHCVALCCVAKSIIWIVLCYKTHYIVLCCITKKHYIALCCVTKSIICIVLCYKMRERGERSATLPHPYNNIAEYNYNDIREFYFLL